MAKYADGEKVSLEDSERIRKHVQAQFDSDEVVVQPDDPDVVEDGEGFWVTARIFIRADDVIYPHEGVYVNDRSMAVCRDCGEELGR